jgi:hypothetical protein
VSLAPPLPVAPPVPVVTLLMHALFAQCCVTPHMCPHAPQLVSLALVSTQAVPHCVCPFEQLAPPVPPVPPVPPFVQATARSAMPSWTINADTGAAVMAVSIPVRARAGDGRARRSPRRISDFNTSKLDCVFIGIPG